MLNEHVTYFRKVLVLADLCVVTGAFFLTYHLFHDVRKLYPLDYYLWVWPVLVTLWLVLFYALGMYVSFRLKSALEILWIILRVAVLGFVIFSSIYFMLKITYLSRSFIFLLFAVSAVLLSLEKLTIMLFFKRLRKMGFNFRNILVVGTGQRALHFMRRVNETPEFGLKIIGIVDQDPARLGQTYEGYPVIGTLDDWKEVLGRFAVDHVFFFVPRDWLHAIEAPMQFCETVGIPVSVAVNIFHMQYVQGRHSEEFGIPLITYDATTGKVGQLIFKRFFDIVFSLLALLVFLPVYMVVGILVKATSRGPLFFKQERCTLNGRRFKIYKFRTMVADAEQRLEELKHLNEMSGPVFKIKKDPRLTRIGAFLRKFSLDELPQFWNVFVGNMSIVGPRPPLPQEVEKYAYWQKRRLSMRAGLTCLWQISGRSNIKDFEEWMRLDMEYIQNWSLKLDYKIVLKTIPAVLVGKGSK